MQASPLAMRSSKKVRLLCGRKGWFLTGITEVGTLDQFMAQETHDKINRDAQWHRGCQGVKQHGEGDKVSPSNRRVASVPIAKYVGKNDECCMERWSRGGEDGADH